MSIFKLNWSWTLDRFYGIFDDGTDFWLTYCKMKAIENLINILVIIKTIQNHQSFLPFAHHKILSSSLFLVQQSMILTRHS